jgi:hypothetical protein
MMFEDYSAKAAGCQGVTHMGRKGQRRQDLALETAMPPALIWWGPATGNGGICVSCAPQLLCEQPNARSTFVERASESKTIHGGGVHAEAGAGGAEAGGSEHGSSRDKGSSRERRSSKV